MEKNQKKNSVYMIFKIFKHDVKGLSRNILALVVAGGLCVLPCLYAWFNIYSNWDPYGSTANVPIAVVSEDAGYTTNSGEYENLGKNVIESLHDNHKLGWVFCESKEEAIEGVRSGEYYAAIVMGCDFSERMYNFVDSGLEHPTVTYYQNEKKNAVAIKITDTGKSTLQSTINTEFLNTMVCTIFEALQENSEGEDVLDTLISKLEVLNENLENYLELVETLKDTNLSLASTISTLNSMIPQMASAIDDAAANSGKITSGIKTDEETVNKKVDEAFEVAGQAIDGISSALSNLSEAMGDTDSMETYLNSAIANCDKGIAELEGRTDSISTSTVTALQGQKILLSNMLVFVQTAGEWSEAKSKVFKPLLEDASKIASTLAESYKKDIAKQIVDASENLSTMVEDLAGTLTQASDSLGGVGNILGSFKSTILGMNDTLDGSDSLLSKTLEKTAGLLEKLNETGDTELYKRIISILHTDPELYGAFLSAPVEVTTERIWQVENYGSGVTPFYTTLALWVGGILLVSIFKVHAEAEGEFEGASHHQLFLGRFILFWMLGQIQAVLTVLGNLYLLKVQCLYPGKFMLAASITSFVFVLFIYTLTNAWGDIGKAAVVVIVVMQIAGSSGTYPIEILPSFFQKLYVYFPFPYAINAMRECIAGMYENTYAILLCKLLIFAVVSLLIGLLLRIPFIRINEFVEERMEDTKMM